MNQSDNSNATTIHVKRDSNSVIESLVSGAISSSITTVVYQPLELLKTRIQLRNESIRSKDVRSIFGRAIRPASHLLRTQGVWSLWTGTGASLLRSGPGVGLYYALLNILQTNFSGQNHRPDSATQAFYFGMTARSMVSFVLLPITVVKVRYESGLFNYPSLLGAIKSAYLSHNGWTGLAPTVIRDSLFSGTYYMCYTRLKANHDSEFGYDQRTHHLRTFSYGVLSGLIASIMTNPIDVIKTNIQVTSTCAREKSDSTTMQRVFRRLMREPGGAFRLFDGLVPRSARRTMIAASTWTFYELMIDMTHARR